MKIIAETEDDLEPDHAERIRREIAAFHIPGTHVEVRTIVPGTGRRLFQRNYKTPTIRIEE